MLSLSEPARDCFLSQWGWQKWLVSTLLPIMIRFEQMAHRQQQLMTLTASTSLSSSFSLIPSRKEESISSKDEQAIKELVFKLVDLVFSNAINQKNGWKEVEYMKTWLHILCIQGKRRNNIQRAIYAHLMSDMKRTIHRIGHSNQNPFKQMPSKQRMAAIPPTKPVEVDLSAPLWQNYIHLCSMYEEFIMIDMNHHERDEEEWLSIDEDDETHRKRLKKEKKEQLSGDFELMDNILYIFDCVFWNETTLQQAERQNIFGIKNRRFLFIITQLTLLVIDVGIPYIFNTSW